MLLGLATSLAECSFKTGNPCIAVLGGSELEMIVDQYAHCAPNIAYETLAAVILIESGGDPLAINVNGGRQVKRPKNVKNAVKIAKRAMKVSSSVDLGLMQVNSKNLPWLGYTVEDMFDPCKNIRAGGKVLTLAYQTTAKTYGEGMVALHHALSMYNTGSSLNGFRNGYVSRYRNSKLKARLIQLASNYTARSIKIKTQETQSRLKKEVKLNSGTADHDLGSVTNRSTTPQHGPKDAQVNRLKQLRIYSRMLLTY